MTVWGILENLLSDFLFLGLAVVIAWFALWLSHRRALRAFFGVTSSKRIVIYLSKLTIFPFGAVAIDGRRMSYQGSAIAYGEMIAANAIRALFTFPIPSLGDRPGLLASLLLSDVSTQLMVSPLHKDTIDAQSPFITLGSPAYNTASHFVEKRLNPMASFRYGVVREDDIASGRYEVLPTAYSTNVESLFSAGYTLPSAQDEEDSSPDHQHTQSAIVSEGVPHITDPTYGFVQRLRDDDHNRMVLYIAGLSELATTGAATFLVSEWRRLNKSYGPTDPFLVMLRVQATDYTKWTVVFEKHQLLRADSHAV